MHDKIIPEHYHKGGIDVIGYMALKYPPEFLEGFLVGNILKYTTRYRDKNGLEDLRKAERFLMLLIKHVEQRTEQKS